MVEKFMYIPNYLKQHYPSADYETLRQSIQFNPTHQNSNPQHCKADEQENVIIKLLGTSAINSLLSLPL